MTPYFVNFDATSSFSVLASLPNAIGVYDITVTATIPQPSNPSGVKEVSQPFVLTVLGDCHNTNLIDMPVTNMLVKVTQTTT